MDFIFSTTKMILQNWQNYWLGGILVVFAIVVFEGLLKKYFLDKVIKNKLVRKIILSFLSIALAFPSTAIYLFIEKISFDYYWYGVVTFILLTIITYWVYENTGARNAIHFIGKNTLLKFFTIGYKALIDNTVNVEQEFTNESKKLKKMAKTELSKVKSEDLKKL